MKHISVLIPQGDISLSNVEGVHHIFTEVNNVLKNIGHSPLFKIQLVGKHPNNFLKEGYFSIHPNYLITEHFKTDLLIIPALHTDIAKVMEQNKDLIPWIIEQHRQGTEIMSICTGAFLLAATGLLSGKKCTTHWIHTDEFRKMYPDVILLKDEIMTDENGIYTSGAAYSYLNLILYIVEKYTNREIMIFISKIFAIDTDRNKQSQFIIFQGYKHHEDEYILKVQDYIENHYHQKITVDQLAQLVSLGRRNLERRFKVATSNSVVEYIQRVKIEAAKKLLESRLKTISEVMYAIGYNDAKAFRDVFKRISGMSPQDYKSRFNKEEMNLMAN
jgi:transcriptional regulator GlxA family with amidase domain